MGVWLYWDTLGGADKFSGEKNDWIAFKCTLVCVDFRMAFSISGVFKIDGVYEFFAILVVSSF